MRAGFHRTDRISALLRREIGALVHEAVREKLIPSVSVSDVEVTRDLAHATVYVTALQGEHGPAAVKELNAAAWEFRRELAQRVELRSMPALHFRYDDSVDRGERIDALLREPVAAPVVETPPPKKRAPRKTAAAKADPTVEQATAKKAPAKKRAPRKPVD